jgi:hypothetical protein
VGSSFIDSHRPHRGKLSFPLFIGISQLGGWETGLTKNAAELFAEFLVQFIRVQKKYLTDVKKNLKQFTSNASQRWTYAF